MWCFISLLLFFMRHKKRTWTRFKRTFCLQKYAYYMLELSKFIQLSGICVHNFVWCKFQNCWWWRKLSVPAGIFYESPMRWQYFTNTPLIVTLFIGSTVWWASICTSFSQDAIPKNHTLSTALGLRIIPLPPLPTFNHVLDPYTT